MRKEILLVSLIGLLSGSCTNDSESDLKEPDSPTAVSYEANIKQIISNNCLACHKDPPVNAAPFALNTYDLVRDRTENSNLLASMNRQTGESAAMPPAGRLPQATIDLIEQWANEGFLE